VSWGCGGKFGRVLMAKHWRGPVDLSPVLQACRAGNLRKAPRNRAVRRWSDRL